MLEQRQQASGSLSVTVVGAGYAGIELATTLAERIGPRGFVQIIHGGELLYWERVPIWHPLPVHWDLNVPPEY